MSCIKVCVRLRPISEARKEKWAPGFELHGRRLTLGTKTYDPDVCLNTGSTQDDVFSHAMPILDAVRDGSNGTILVYGQTGTGKTHTMIGGNGEYDGVSIRAIEYLLDHVREQTLIGKEVALAMSVLEIYNERITDMLSQDGREVTIAAGFPRNASQVPLGSMDEAVSTMRRALHSRHVSETAMNERSSRSHVIFMLDLIEVIDGATQTSHLFLVDLAGSESIKKSQVTGKAAQEAGMINKSLLALKNVILTLSTASQDPHNRGYVPYRDSRLTELLQDSIGGSARTMFIACISPNGRDVDETKSTLDYATKARTIRNASNTERDRLKVKCRSLEMEVLKLRNKLDRTAEKNGYYMSREDYDRYAADAEELSVLRTENATLQEDCTAAKSIQTISKSQIAIFKDMAEEKERELERFKSVFAKAIQQLHTATGGIESALQRNVNAVADAVNDDTEAQREQIARVLRALEGEDLVTASVAELDGMWARVNRRHNENVADAARAIEELSQKVTQTQSETIRSVEAMLAEAVASVASAQTSILAKLHSTQADFRQDTDVAQAAVTKVKGQAADLSEREAAAQVARSSFRHARDIVMGLPQAQMSDRTERAMRSCAAEYCGQTKAAVRSALGRIQGINLPAELARPTVAPAAPVTQEEEARASILSGGTTAAAASGDAAASAASTSDQADVVVSAPPQPQPRRALGRTTSVENSQAYHTKRSRSRATDAALEQGRRRATTPSSGKI